MAIQVGPNDVPATCAKHGQQLHRPGVDGKLACLKCMTEALGAPTSPSTITGDLTVTNNGPTLGSQFRNAIVIVILLFAIILIYSKACNAGGH